MKKYIAIGHFKDSKNVTSVVIPQVTKKAAVSDCYGNAFVPYVVLTEKTFKNLPLNDDLEVFYLVKKMTTNYRIWGIVTDYLTECADLIIEKLNNAEE